MIVPALVIVLLVIGSLLGGCAPAKKSGGEKIVEIDASQPPAKVLWDMLGEIMQLEAWHEVARLNV